MGEIPRADPAATPRVAKRGEARRETPVFRVVGDEWLVEVTPIEDRRYGVRFEVRAEYPSAVLPEFLFSRNECVRRCVEHYIADHDLALRVAQRTEELLARGSRDIFLPRVEAEVS